MPQKTIRVGVHLIFWIITSSMSIFLLGYKTRQFSEAAMFTLLFMPVTAGTAYFVSYRLIPQYYFTKQYGKLILYSFYTLVAALYAVLLLDVFALMYLAGYQFSQLLPVARDTFTLMAIMLMNVFLFVTFRVTHQWQSLQTKLESLKAQQAQNELKFLKEQLNPHFLFNTLNNLYVLTLQQSPAAPEAIEKLSNLLDYTLYQTEAPTVPLALEWEKVQDFVYLENLRYADRLEITLKKEVTDSKAEVPVLLLISLLENCFKHGVKNSQAHSYIHLGVRQEKEFLVIHTENTVISSSDKDKGGVGLQNLNRQLKLLYDRKYAVKVKETHNLFTVHIKIPAHA